MQDRIQVDDIVSMVDHRMILLSFSLFALLIPSGPPDGAALPPGRSQAGTV
jgi:hypothetical protein